MGVAMGSRKSGTRSISIGWPIPAPPSGSGRGGRSRTLATAIGVVHDGRWRYKGALTRRDPDTWLVPVCVPDGARTALVAFPQAGAGPAAFVRWRGALGEDTGLWAVCLPGRDHRLAVPPVAELAPLVQGAAAAIGDLRAARLVLL